ncbi:Uncharacterised protein [Pandoraea pulmonicola]|uniref:Uncharacterized protein n=2 Tax=Pandoraea pulmonicola TaxID=93221 RepID=A0AAJ4ZEW2_PANPU|nr:Uncharacterised protein [Pandoraea pulmonicola]
MSPPAKIACKLPTDEIVKEIHAQMEAQKKAHGEHGGKKWFKEQGGREGLTKKYGINVKALDNYFCEDGTLRAEGDDVVNGASKNPVTNKILQQCEQLRSEGKWPKDGVPAVAKKFNVKYTTLKNYYTANGTPKRPPHKSRRQRIEQKILETSQSEAQKRSAPQDASSVTDGTSMPPPAKIACKLPTDEIVKEIHAQMEAQKKAHGEHGGKKWFKEQGGRKGLAKKYGIDEEILKNYFRANGDLRADGHDVVYGDSKEKLTDEKMLECAQLGSAGKWPKGGLKEVAEKILNVKHRALRHFFKANGTPTTPRGEARLKWIEEGISVGLRKIQGLAQRKSHSQVD